jgi:chemotaxis protein CheX
VTDTLTRNQDLLRHVETSTTEVFATMLDIKVALDGVSVSGDSTTSNTGLLATIGIAGPVSGSGSICLSKSFGCKIASRFLMSEYSEVNDDVLDAMAELTNMIIGGAKTALEDKLGPIGLSIPTVIFGESYLARRPNGSERMILSFRCEDDPEERFTVLICLVPGRQDRSYLRELAAFHARLA